MLSTSRAERVGRLETTYRLPKKFIPLGSVDEMERRIGVISNRNLLWILQHGAGISLLKARTEEIFQRELEKMEQDANRMLLLYGQLGYGSNEEDITAFRQDQLTKFIQKRLLTADYISACETASQIFFSAGLEGDARQAAMNVVIRMFDGGSSIQNIAFLFEEIRAADKLDDSIRQFVGLKQECMRVNMSSSRKLAALAIIPEAEFEERVQVFSQLIVYGSDGKPIQFLEDRTALCRVSVNYSAEELQKRASFFVTNYPGFDATVFAVNPQLLEQPTERVNTETIAFAYIYTAQRMVEEGKNESAKHYAELAAALPKDRMRPQTGFSINGLNAAIDSLLEAQRLIGKGRPFSEIKKALTQTYQRCSVERSDRNVGKVRSTAMPIARVALIMLAEQYHLYCRSEAVRLRNEVALLRERRQVVGATSFERALLLVDERSCAEQAWG